MKTRIVTLILASFALAFSAMAQEKKLKPLPPEVLATEYLYDITGWIKSSDPVTEEDVRAARAPGCPNDSQEYVAKAKHAGAARCSDVVYEKYTSGANVTVVMVLGTARRSWTCLADGVCTMSESVSGGGNSHLVVKMPTGVLYVDTSAGFDPYLLTTPHYEERRGMRTYYGVFTSPPATCDTSTLGWMYFDAIGYWLTCHEAGGPSWGP